MAPATTRAKPRVENEMMRMKETDAPWLLLPGAGLLGCGVGTGLRSTTIVVTDATATSQLQLDFSCVTRDPSSKAAFN